MLKLKFQYFDHLIPRANSLEKTLILGMIDGRRRRGRQRVWCLDGITDSMDVSLSKLGVRGKDREAWHAAAHGVAKGWTRLSDWTNHHQWLRIHFPRRVGWGGRWEGGSKGRRYMYTYGWFMLRFDRKQWNFFKAIILQSKNNNGKQTNKQKNPPFLFEGTEEVSSAAHIPPTSQGCSALTGVRLPPPGSFRPAGSRHTHHKEERQDVLQPEPARVEALHLHPDH